MDKMLFSSCDCSETTKSPSLKLGMQMQFGTRIMISVFRLAQNGGHERHKI